MESALVKKIVSGDIQAFEMLFNDYYKRLAYFAFKYLEDKDSAEDVVQELFSKLWLNRHQLSIETSLNAYLYGAVRNACLNQLQHQKIKENYVAAASGSSAVYEALLPDQIDANNLSLLIQSCIIDLPPERQKIFLMSREHDLKYKEIADQLGISVKTVEAQMGKALRFLRERLKEYLVVWTIILLKSIIYL
ncbi:DNA-directed RNA polymerase sigma-70 factor [Marivirga lumbricoides]|uniref:DNA-directed RNA polymerase sigma-70 factor n=1 Tax=Marivirga lumbricoides TaxID=1046115 RepID=A0ABQ1MEH1_9BACT|nr:DNA-directed RNA polymerase sigma-70 factor [Marivirga lumbricoides]